MKLYSYFRSSASYRVRIALNIKGIKADMVPVNLLAGEQKQAPYLAVNPQGLLPALVDDNHTLTQSLAIMEYLEETHPTLPLLPKHPAERARVRALALMIACEMAPLNNLGSMNYLRDTLKLGDAERASWYQHWIAKGFTAFEAMLAQSSHTGRFCYGDTPGMADCVLIPQVFNAKRYECDLSAFPTINRIVEACDAHPAFIAAHPSKQTDAK